MGVADRTREFFDCAQNDRVYEQRSDRGCVIRSDKGMFRLRSE